MPSRSRLRRGYCVMVGQACQYSATDATWSEGRAEARRPDRRGLYGLGDADHPAPHHPGGRPAGAPAEPGARPRLSRLIRGGAPFRTRNSARIEALPPFRIQLRTTPARLRRSLPQGETRHEEARIGSWPWPWRFRRLPSPPRRRTPRRPAQSRADAAASAAAGDRVAVHYINVDQGSAALLEFPCGAILIDAGGRNSASTSAPHRLSGGLLRATDRPSPPPRRRLPHPQS